MFSVLVVEDEKWIRNGIIHKLKKSTFSFDAIYDAKNGHEAFEIVKKNKVDIIITDICMPDMNGIELIEKVKGYLSSMEFIIISGYSEFKYAEAAINMGVKSYLLKPTTDEDLTTALNKVILQINKRKQYDNLSKENISIKMYNEKLIYEKELNLLLKANNKELKSEILETYYPSIFCECYRLLILNIDYDFQRQKNRKYDTIDSIKNNIIHYLVTTIQDDNYYAFNNVDISNQLLILIWGDKKQVEKVSNTISRKCFYECLQKLDVSATIGMSALLNNLNDVLYRSAKKALDLRLIYGQNKIYREDQGLTDAFIFPKNELKLLKKNIERRSIKNIEVLLAEIFSKKRFKQSSVGNLYFVYSEVVNILYELLYSTDVNDQNIIEYDLTQFDIMSWANQLEDIALHLYQVIEDKLKMKKKSPINCREVLEQAVKYIDGHYEEKINVKILSAKFGITANYFSTIFKKELGVTCTKYLTMKRLNNACRMLQETDINVEEIAKSVGYEDLQYFYRVFKKEFSVTPIEYRSGNIKLIE